MDDSQERRADCLYSLYMHGWVSRSILYFILPLLATGIVSQPGAHTIKDKTYCWCDGEDVGQMIACNNPSCSKEWPGFTLSVLVSLASQGGNSTVLNHAPKTLSAHTTEYLHALLLLLLSLQTCQLW